MSAQGSGCCLNVHAAWLRGGCLALHLQAEAMQQARLSAGGRQSRGPTGAQSCGKAQSCPGTG